LLSLVTFGAPVLGAKKFYMGKITISNKSPDNATCVTPPWVGIHDGEFDTYSGDEALKAPFESLVEDGSNAAVKAYFAMANGTVWDGQVGMGPICYGESAELSFEIGVEVGVAHYFSYASMILPSNDAWVSNGNPMAYEVFDMDGNGVAVSFTVMGSDVLDAGSEVNDELTNTTAFFGQMEPNTGETENGVVVDHPGFMAKGMGGILDDPLFANADFTAAGYMVMEVEVTVEEIASFAPTSAPTKDTTTEMPSAAVTTTTLVAASVSAIAFLLL
jgi:hypothetical protein